MGDFDIILDHIESKMLEASHTLRGACKSTGESPTPDVKNPLVCQVKNISPSNVPFLIPFIGAIMLRLFKSTAVHPLDGSVTTSGLVICGNGETPVDTFLDLDLETVSSSKQPSSCRTGTMPFMARGVLNLNNKEFTRGLHHDLESLLYTVVWQGVGYKGHKTPKRGDILADWRKDSWSKSLNAKTLFITSEAIGPNSMDEVLEYVEDEELQTRCQGIGTCFHDANIDAGNAKRLNNIAWRKLSFQERLLTDKGKEKVAPPVTYVEWMKGAGEDPLCPCCQQMGDTQ
ncbi:hypothetical protein DFH11DRAFT_632766 [Phellopilus nigrolimitatus]|nr:hypothetical protein DFH11DRAFT_632766 [Phellopilus nigrolimitatus]